MILRFDPKTKETTVFADTAFKSNGLMFDAGGHLLSLRRRRRRRPVRPPLGRQDRQEHDHRRPLPRASASTRPTTSASTRKGGSTSPTRATCGTEPRELEHRGRLPDRDRRHRRRGHPRRREAERHRPQPRPEDALRRRPQQRRQPPRLPTTPSRRRGAMKVYAFPLDADGLVRRTAKTLVDFGKENGSDGMRVDARATLPRRPQPGPARHPGPRPDRQGAGLHHRPGRANQSGLFEDRKGIPSNVEFGIGDDEQHALRHDRQEPVSDPAQDARLPHLSKGN